MGIKQIINDAKQTLIKPSDAAKKLKSNSDIKTGVTFMGVMIFISGLLASILLMFGAIIKTVLDIALGRTVDFLLAIIMSLGTVIFFFLAYPLVLIALIITMLIWLGVIFGLSKVLGGKSTFGEYFGTLSYVIGSVTALSLIWFGITSFISTSLSGIDPMIGALIGAILSLPLIVITIYCLWLQILFTKEVQNIDIIRAFASVLIPILIIGFVLIVLIIILILLFGTAFLGF